ncbi:MAG: 50S ribosomal protein L10 [Calditrichaeota bacterium]|nr:MAG: 50S ribosomal protein L10 [Calditrichota bacterium]
MQTYTREPRPEKVAEVEKLSEKLTSAKGVYLTDFSGLSVEDITDLRRRFTKENVEYLVVKNTLAKFGAKKAGQEDLVEHFRGPVAVALGYEDPATPARILTSFLKEHEKPEVKACMIEGDVLPGSEVDSISKWLTREELLAKLVGSLNSPVSGLVNTLAGVLRQFVTVLDAIREKKENH